MVRYLVSIFLVLGMTLFLPNSAFSQEDTTLAIRDTIVPQQDTLLLTQDTIAPEKKNLNILDSSLVYFFKNDFEVMGPEFIQEIDTLITNVENYDPPIQPGQYFASLGNPGSSHKSIVYKPYIKSGFDFGIRSFDRYLFHNDSIHHYWVGRPYTHLFFIQGSKKEQNLRVDHSQNVSSWFNLGVHFRYVNSPGLYLNQEADDKNFVFKTRFQTRNYRYMVLANYIHNKISLEENGGILYDSVFTENVSPNRAGIDVNLNSAKNRYKENSYYVKQLFKLSKRHRFRAEDDSTQYVSLIDKLNPGNLSFSTLLSQKTYLYEQPTSDNVGFYDFTYDSINGTYDSTYTLSVENQLSWTNGDNARKRLMTVNFTIRHLYTEHSVDSMKFIYNQFIPTGLVKFQVSDVLKLDFFGDIVFGDSFSGDFNLAGKLVLTTKFGDLKYEMINANQSVGRFYSFYRSNHFRWENNFDKQYFFLNKASYHYKNFTAGINLFAIENFIYSDENGFPDQLNSNLQVMQLYAKKVFNLGKWSLDARLIYQKASNTQGLRIPDLVGDFSIFYTKDLFKQAAIIQTGFDLRYNTSYYAYAYMPATRDFHIQNHTEVGDYLYVDVFLNLQVKRARIFVMYNNLGFLFGDFRYFTVPSYPMRDGGIRFGVSWMFYD